MRAFIVKISIYSILFLAIITVVGKLLEKQRADKLIFHPQLRWQEFHSTPQNSIDVIFIGSSHCYRSFVPKIIDTRLGVNSFNLGSSSQSIFTSYFVLKEALEFQSPNIIVFEVFNGTFQVSENESFVDLMYNYDYFKSDNVKKEVKLSLSLNKNIEMLFPAYRYNHNLNLLLKSPGVNADKLENSKYSHKGYVETDLPSDYYKANVLNVSAINSKKINEQQLVYFQKVVDLLQQKNINLLLITQPSHPDVYKQTKHMNQNLFLRDLADKNELVYFNFSENDILTAGDYYDAHHLNKLGAEKFSHMLCDTLTKN